MASDLTRLFEPRAVAVVGASADPQKRGHIILKNIVDGGFAGPVYPINPRGGTILGLAAYPSLDDVPGPVDLAVIAVAAPLVAGVVEGCGRRGVAGAVVISGNFREAGNDDLEAELVAVARRTGVRVIGPNCQGIARPGSRLCATWPLMKDPGGMAIISQSGTVGAAFALWASAEGLGVSAFVSLGNRCDVDESDLIDFFGGDAATRAIALYLEGVRDGRRFMDVAGRVGREKPVVVLKSGRTASGRRAAQSHTRSVAGRDEVFDAACRQAGVVKAGDVEDLYDRAKALAMLAPPRGARLGVVTSSGGSGILATDAAAGAGLCVPALGAGTVAALRAALPAHCIAQNPLDLTGDTDAARYAAAAPLLRDEVDMVLLIFGDPIPGACEAALRVRDETGLPVAALYLGGGEVEAPERCRLNRAGIPVFATPERAARALAAPAGWARRAGLFSANEGSGAR